MASDYPNFVILGVERDSLDNPPFAIGDNVMTQGIGFPLHTVAEGSGVPIQVISAESTADQTPPNVGIATQISFGPAAGGPGAPITLAPDGTITFNNTAIYTVDGTFTVARQAAPAGTSLIAIRELVQGIPFGVSSGIEMTTDEMSYQVGITRTIFLNAGSIMTFQMILDSAGANNGFLKHFDLTDGWLPIPSASLRISIYE